MQAPFLQHRNEWLCQRALCVIRHGPRCFQSCRFKCADDRRTCFHR